MTHKLVKTLIGLGILAGAGYVVWNFVLPKAFAQGGGSTTVLETPVSTGTEYKYNQPGMPYSGTIIPSGAYFVNIP